MMVAQGWAFWQEKSRAVASGQCCCARSYGIVKVCENLGNAQKPEVSLRDGQLER